MGMHAYIFIALFEVDTDNNHTCTDAVILFSVVILSGTTTNADFQGFLVQARVMASDTATGTFTDNGDDQQLVCTGDVSVIRSQMLYSYSAHIHYGIEM